MPVSGQRPKNQLQQDLRRTIHEAAWRPDMPSILEGLLDLEPVTATTLASVHQAAKRIGVAFEAFATPTVVHAAPLRRRDRYRELIGAACIRVDLRAVEVNPV